MGREVR